MWADRALPLLRSIGLGTDVAARTYRLTGIGESQVADLLGEPLLRAANPIVATYARTEAVDVRISAVAAPPRSAEDLVDEAAATVLEHLGTYVWATGETTWSDAIGARLAELGWTLAAVEIGTGGSLSSAARRRRLVPLRRGDRRRDPGGPGPRAGRRRGADGEPTRPGGDLLRFARRARELGGAEVGRRRADTRSGRRHRGLDRRVDAGGRAAGQSRRLSDRVARTIALCPGGGGVRARGPAGGDRRRLTDNGARANDARLRARWPRGDPGCLLVLDRDGWTDERRSAIAPQHPRRRRPRNRRRPAHRRHRAPRHRAPRAHLRRRLRPCVPFRSA